MSFFVQGGGVLADVLWPGVLIKSRTSSSVGKMGKPRQVLADAVMT